MTDCEDRNKKALETVNRMREDGSISSDYSLLIALPDVVHVGKSIKCSWANWFILLDGQRSNLVLLRTLRDSSDPDVRKKLRKLLTLECVRIKDRMAVDVIVLLTRIAVINVLEKVPYVVHTILPEKYRFWKSNMPELCPHPISVGRFGKLLVLDYEPEKKVSKLLMLRLHNPIDVSVFCENISDARNMCYANGVCYIAERGARCIRFVDIEGRVQLKVNRLHSRAQLETELAKRELSCSGTVPILKQRLESFLKKTADMINDKGCRNVMNLDAALSKPTALCMASEDIICADDGTRCLLQITLSFDGVTINGTVNHVAQYPPTVSSVLSLAVTKSYLYISGKGDSEVSGLYLFDMSTRDEAMCVLSNQTAMCKCFHSVSVFGENVAFTDVGQKKTFAR